MGKKISWISAMQKWFSARGEQKQNFEITSLSKTKSWIDATSIMMCVSWCVHLG